MKNLLLIGLGLFLGNAYCRYKREENFKKRVDEAISTSEEKMLGAFDGLLATAEKYGASAGEVRQELNQAADKIAVENGDSFDTNAE